MSVALKAVAAKRGAKGKSLLGPRDMSVARRRSVSRKIPLHWIFAVTQVRRTFTDVPRLAEDIAVQGLLEPILVVRYTRVELQRYLDAINSRDKSRLRTQAYKPVDGFYYLLIAGESRLRALRILWDEGCEACKERGPVQQGACYRRHIGSDRVDVKLYTSIPVLDALSKQMSENVHTRPPEHEEAYNIVWMLGTFQAVDPTVTPGQLSRRIGRTLETVKKAILFCVLPEEIRQSVARSIGKSEQGRWTYLRYGHAVELARLYEAHEPASALLRWRDRIVHDQLSVPDTRRQVNKRLMVLTGGQRGLFAEPSEAQLQHMSMAHTKRAVAQNMIVVLHQSLTYAATLLHLLNTGQVGAAGSPFSSRSPRTILLKLLGVLKQINEHELQLLTKTEQQEMGATIISLQKATRELNRRTPRSRTKTPKHGAAVASTRT